MAVDCPISVEMAFVSASVMLGEPVVLAYTIHNAAETTLRVYTGGDYDEWLTLALVDATGQPAAPRIDPLLRLPPSGGVASDGVRISPGSGYSQYVQVSREVEITHPGAYHLAVTARLPYGTEPEADGVPPDQLEQKFGTVFHWRSILPLIVTEADPVRLRETAKVLLRNAIEAQSGRLRRLSLATLFSMPARYALPTWKASATDPRLASQRALIASRLQQTNSLEAADVLADMIWNAPSALHLKRYLDNMYFQADDALKEHIVSLFRQHASEVSGRPIRPLS